MLRFATIGTSAITEQFIHACQANPEVEVRRIYSRTLEKARAFADRMGVLEAVDSLEALCADGIDAVYIASPNSVHFDQAMAVLKAGKHAIVEKPQFANTHQWETAHAFARQQGCYLFEAALHVHHPHFAVIKEVIQKASAVSRGRFLGAQFHVGQYSSRYDVYLTALKEGTPVPNIFHPDFAAGTLMDLGFYSIYLAVGLFGLPTSVQLYCLEGPNGIDLVDQIILKYASFQVSIFVSKAVHTQRPNEIYLGDTTLVLPHFSILNHFSLVNRQGESLQEWQCTRSNPMQDELAFFCRYHERARGSIPLRCL